MEAKQHFLIKKKIILLPLKPLEHSTLAAMERRLWQISGSLSKQTTKQKPLKVDFMFNMF